MSHLIQRICSHFEWTYAADHVVVPLPAGRHQKVFFEVSEQDGEEMLRLHTLIGEAAMLNEPRMRAALRLNYQMRFGAFAIRKEQLALVDTFLLREADRDEVMASMKYLAETADYYEDHIFGTDEH